MKPLCLVAMVGVMVVGCGKPEPKLELADPSTTTNAFDCEMFVNITSDAPPVFADRVADVLPLQEVTKTRTEKVTECPEGYRYAQVFVGGSRESIPLSYPNDYYSTCLNSRIVASIKATRKEKP